MSETSYVYNELIHARQCEMKGMLDMMIFQLDDARLTERFAFQLNHISDANHTGRLYRDLDLGLEGMVNKVKYLLHCRRAGCPEKPFDVFEPELNGIPVGHGGFFVPHSRDEILERIEEALQDSNVIFAIQIPGYGRRTAVQKYAEWRYDQFEHMIIYVHCIGSGCRSKGEKWSSGEVFA